MESYKTSVIDNLPKAYLLLMLLFGDEALAKSIILEGSKQFLSIHDQNINKIRGQKNWQHKHTFNKRNIISNRKDAIKRKYIPTGGDLFSNIIRELAEFELQKRVLLDYKMNSCEAMSALFFKLFENDNIISGAFLPMIATFQILYNVHHEIMPEINAHIHGIDAQYGRKKQDFRDVKFFLKNCAKLLSDLNRLWADSGYFKTVTLSELDLPEEIKQLLDDDIQSWIKFEPVNGDTQKDIQILLNVFAPWGNKPLSPTDIPKYNLRHNRIEKLVHQKHPDELQNLINESRIESLRTVTSMCIEFVEALINHESVRKNDMKNNLNVPVLNFGEFDLTTKLSEFPPLDIEFVLSVATNELSKPLNSQLINDCVLAIEVDKIEIETISPKYGKGKVEISKNSRMVSVIAKKRCGDDENSIKLGTILVGLTDLEKGETWISESVFENDYHLKMELVPMLDKFGELESIIVDVDYHKADECTLNQNKRIWAKFWRKLNKLRKGFVPGGLVSIPVENFLNNIESVKAFSVKDSQIRGIKSSIAFTLLVNFVVIALWVGVHFFANKFSKYFIVPEIILVLTTIIVVMCLIFGNLLYEKRGINKVFKFCNQFSFFSGMLSLVLITSIFTYSWNKTMSSEFAMKDENFNSNKGEDYVSETDKNSSDNKSMQDNTETTSQSNELSLEKPVEQSKTENEKLQQVRHSGKRKPLRNSTVVQYLSGHIDASKITQGTEFQARNSDTDVNSSTEKLIDKNKNSIPDTVSAKITYVDRNSCQGNNIVLRVKLVNLLTGSETKKPSNANEEVTLLIAKDQSISIALYLEADKFIYATSVANNSDVTTEKVSPSNPNETVSPPVPKSEVEKITESKENEKTLNAYSMLNKNQTK